jgi:hypothetical protein
MNNLELLLASHKLFEQWNALASSRMLLLNRIRSGRHAHRRRRPANREDCP